MYAEVTKYGKEVAKMQTQALPAIKESPRKQTSSDQ
jgi:hypothetical protein